MSRTATSTDTLKLPLAIALEQLPRGAVRISFSELRKRASPGIFEGSGDPDETLVELPLAEVLKRLKHSHLARRPQQKQVVLLEGVPAVFTSRGSSPKPARPAEPQPQSPLNRSRDELPGSRMITERHPASGNPMPSPAPISMAPLSTSAGQRPSASAIPVSRLNTSAAPNTVPAPAISMTPSVAPRETDSVKVPLVPLAKGWPDSIQNVVMASHAASSVHFPFADLEAAMKRGKAVFSWQQIRGWIGPRSCNDGREFDATELELPLAVLAPAFLSRRSTRHGSGSSAPKKVTAAAEIPDIFAGRQSAAPGVAPAPAPAPEAAPEAQPKTLEQRISAGLASTLAAPTPQKAPPATEPSAQPFDKQPAARSNAVPAELIQRVCHLGGVAGALLVTPDGLVIAGQLPTGITAETTAAFLPKVFRHSNQFTRELKLGDPRQIEIVAGGVPLQILDVGSAYFAVLGKAGEPLPKLQLSSIAGQLMQRTQ